MATTKPKKTTTKKATTKTAKPAEKPVAKKTTKAPAEKVAAKKPEVKSAKTAAKDKHAKFNPCKIIVPVAIFVALIAIIIGVVFIFCFKDRDMSCTIENEVDSHKVTTVVTATFKDSKVETVDGWMEFETEEDAKTYCDFMKLVDEDGVSCDGKSMTIKDLAEGEHEAEYIGVSRKEFADKLEKNGYTCKR